jgi:hypothetical protein
MLTGFTEEEEANLRSKKPSIELVQRLIESYSNIFTLSTYDSLVAVKTQLKKWNGEIKDSPSSIKLKAEDDADKNKEFEYSVLYFKNILDFNKVEQDLIKQVTPEQARSAEKAASNLNDAERIQRQLNGSKV